MLSLEPGLVVAHLKSLLLGVALSLNVGCAQDPSAEIGTVFDPCSPLPILPAEGTSPRERDSIRQAISIWNDRAGTSLVLGDSEGASRPLPVTFERAPLAFRGFYDPDAGQVFINRGLRRASDRRMTLVHELGHAFGLHHVSSSRRRSVMNPGNLEVGPTDEDLAALETLWGPCRERSP